MGDGSWRLSGAPLDDTGVLTPSGSYTGAVHAVRLGDRVLISGHVDRASGFSATPHNTGIVLPVGFRPAADWFFPGRVEFGTTDSYRFKVLATGELQAQQSAAVTQFQILSDVYLI